VGYLFSTLGSRSRERATTPDRDVEWELLTILGDVAHRPDDLGGRWRPARADGSMPTPDTDAEQKLDELGALPYVQGSTLAPGVENITFYDPDRAFNGVNVYTSGHEAAAFVIDMEGKVLHQWRYEIENVWPQVPRTIHSSFWRRVHPFPNGDLLAIFEGIGVLKLDKDSKLLWAYKGGCHHETYVTGDGRIYVLTRRAQIVPEINPAKPILPDAITILSPEGKPLMEVPLLECFEKSQFVSLLDNIRPYGDIFHTNSIQVFDGTMADRWPFFKKGNVLISMLKQNAIAIVDTDKQEVVWVATESWKRQHDPTVQADGTIMLFDNQGRKGDLSRVIRFDPQSKRITWQFHGPEQDLYSKTCGTSRTLANGNILITESDNGRALEITADKELVWEFYNPHRAGENDELIATLFEVSRFDETYFPWLRPN
jgi:hypothetical protein